MPTNRQQVKKSRILRHLVKHGMDKRKMVRQLSRCNRLNLRTPDIACCMVWTHTPQGHEYWYGVEKRVGRL